MSTAVAVSAIIANICWTLGGLAGIAAALYLVRQARTQQPMCRTVVGGKPMAPQVQRTEVQPVHMEDLRRSPGHHRT